MRPVEAALAGVDAWDVPLHAAAAVTPDVTVVHGDTRRGARIASVSKPLLAFACLVAVEQGVLALDDPAGPPGSTVRHLLAHASGLAFESRTAISHPGTRRIYSDSGFQVLGRTLEAATGKAVAAYLREAVFEPLAMHSSFLDGSPSRDVVSTVADLTRFASELLSPSLIAPSTLALATAEQFPGLAGVAPAFGMQRPCPWGLGFEIRGHKSPHWTGTRNSPGTFGHFGAAGSFLWVDPVAGVALVVLTDRAFGPWAKAAWPPFSDAVLAASAFS